jgi:hypothetical protein
MHLVVRGDRLLASNRLQRHLRLELRRWYSSWHYYYYNVGRKIGRSLDFAAPLATLRGLMRDIRHWSLKDQVARLNQSLRGHYAYYGLAGNWRSLHKVYRFVSALQSELGSEDHMGDLSSIARSIPLQRPTIYLTYGEMQACAVKSTSPSDERRAGNRHATFCGSRERVTAPGHPMGEPGEAPGSSLLGAINDRRMARDSSRGRDSK